MMNPPVINAMFAYDKMKPKQKKQIQEMTYFNLLFEILLSMFNYTDLPESLTDFDTRYIDSILCSTGQIACGMVDDKLTFAPCTLGGQIDAYGLGTEVIAPVPVGKQGEIRGKRNIDVAYGINNKLATPDTLVYYIAHMMSETDVSAHMNVIYSRLLKIPVVKDEKSKQAVMEIYKKLIEGAGLEAMVSPNVFDELVEKGIETIELTDPNKIDRIQYLSRFYDDLLKRFCNFYGQNLQTQNKAAQTQEDELHGYDSFSFIIPLQMLKCRRDFIDNVNRIYGTSIKVDFSDSWKYELARFETRDLNQDGVPDADEIIEDEETAEETTEVEEKDDTTDVEEKDEEKDKKEEKFKGVD